MTQALTARRRRGWALTATGFVWVALLYWAVQHVASATLTIDGEGPKFGLVFDIAFVLLCWQVALYSLDKPFTVPPDVPPEYLDELRVTVVIPVYNEDPAYLRACLESILRQSRPVNGVDVVDDGSVVDYSEVATWFGQEARSRGMSIGWGKKHNGGKRSAQGESFKTTADDTDIYLTIDSDGILDPDAVGEILKPFARKRVQSVAGVVVAANNRKNLLTRMTDLWFVTGQLIDRSAASVMGAVLVNSGVLAAYRANVVTENLEAYLNETFFGHRVEFSDDSKLTMFALRQRVKVWVRGKWRHLNGQAVQQSSAFAFTAMPENVSHHLRQYLRWMRGASIRSFDRFKYLPTSGYAYWGHAMGWTQMVLASVVFVALFVYGPAIEFNWSPWLLAVPALISYGQALRYLTVARSDESLRSQLVTFAMAPIAMIWSFFVLRVVRWYGMATCLKTGNWGTRQNGIEVELA